MNKQKGFTLIELLVVIAIIGILSTLAVFSLNNARQKARDAKIVSDIRSIQTQLELYYNDNGAYPSTMTMDGTGSLVGTGASASTTYIDKIPASPVAGNPYTYASSTTSGGGPSYTITYRLESAAGSISAGAHTATPSGLTNP